MYKASIYIEYFNGNAKIINKQFKKYNSLINYCLRRPLNNKKIFICGIIGGVEKCLQDI